jgi:hypothetical protein
MKPETFFSYTWHPYCIDTKIDYSKEMPTLVAFQLKTIPEGTLLTIIESGFDKIPTYRRSKAFQMNSQGWKEQLVNIKKYVTINKL